MKMFKKLLISVSILLCSYSVQASTPINLGQAYSFNVNGGFSDDYTFTVGSDIGVSGVVWGYKLDGLSFSGISDFSITLSNGLYDIITGFGKTYDAFLTAGDYTMNLSGYAGPFGGQYGFNTTVSPVSEPGVLALMLAGLGIVGFAAKRRMRNAKA